MTNRNPDARYETPEQVIPWMVEQWVHQHVNTCMLGMVDTYDSATKRARVQPGLRTRIAPAGDSPGELKVKPLLLNVPLRQISTGGHMVHHQVDKGDVVLVMFSQRGLNQFKSQWGQISDPDKGSFFAYRDAVAIPWGVETIAPVSDQGVVIQSEDGQTYIHVVDGQIKLVVEGSSITINSSNITAIADRIDLNPDSSLVRSHRWYNADGSYREWSNDGVQGTELESQQRMIEGQGRYRWLNLDGTYGEGTNWSDLPEELSEVILFLPDAPPEPHTPEEHDYMATFVPRLNEVLSRCRR